MSDATDPRAAARRARRRKRLLVFSLWVWAVVIASALIDYAWIPDFAVKGSSPCYRIDRLLLGVECSGFRGSKWVQFALNLPYLILQAPIIVILSPPIAIPLYAILGYFLLYRGRQDGDAREYLMEMAADNRWQNASVYSAADRIGESGRRAERGAFFGLDPRDAESCPVGDQLWLSRFADTPPPSRSGYSRVTRAVRGAFSWLSCLAPGKIRRGRASAKGLARAEESGDP